MLKYDNNNNFHKCLNAAIWLVLWLVYIRDTTVKW